MKHFLDICLLIIGLSIIPRQENVQKVEIYFFNDTRSFPIASDVSLFWNKSNRTYIDTLSMSDRNFVKIVSRNLRQLKKLDKDAYVDYRVAVVLYSINPKQRDTFYTDSKFDKWEYKALNYIDTSNNLRRMFSEFIAK